MNNVDRLIKLRKKIGLSQAEMATELGVTAAALSYWERGKRPIPEMALRLIEVYEEFVDEDAALRKHEEVIRELSIGWAKRLMVSFASGARKNNRKRIQDGLEFSLRSFLRHELSPYQIKRKLQVSIFNRMVDVASRSKGMPMKFMQAMGYLNPAMKVEARDALEHIHELQAPMAPTLVARTIFEEFGQSPSKLFAEWSPKPFATASIGQVHLARLKTGEQVAVKVQYPDIQKSLKSDFSSLSFFADIISVFRPEARSVMAKLQETILDEADYEREKEYLDVFGDLFANTPNIIIPKSYGRFCSRRVLTMDFVEGKSLREFRSAPREDRKKAAETLARFMTATTFKAGLMNTDTNSGNFIFCPGGKVAFIDFGRAAKLEIPGLAELLKAVIAKDAEAAKPFLPQMFELRPVPAGESAKFPFEELWHFFLQQQAHLHSGEFHFTREYIARTMSAGKNIPHKKKMQISIDMVWSLATSMGLWGVLADLDVAVDYGRLSLNVLETSDRN